jgi:hypothetical protein
LPLSWLDRLGMSTPRLVFAFVLAIAIAVGGSMLPVGGEVARSATAFIGGAVLAFALTSWQLNAVERTRAEALSCFWEPFSSDAIICLSTRLPAHDGDELSPFTPLHDAVAGQRVQGYLRDTFGKEVPIVSATDFDSLEKVAAKHVILVGGPNHNHLTEEVMDRLWDKCGDRYFHWASTLRSTDATRPLVDHDHDHLLRLQMVGDELQVDDSVQDIHDGNEDLVEARGMCLRIEDLHRRGSHILVLAGVANAYGTLAALEHALAPDNIIPVAGEDVQLVIGARLNGSVLEEGRCLRTLRGKG